MPWTPLWSWDVSMFYAFMENCCSTQTPIAKQKQKQMAQSCSAVEVMVAFTWSSGSVQTTSWDPAAVAAAVRLWTPCFLPDDCIPAWSPLADGFCGFHGEEPHRQELNNAAFVYHRPKEDQLKLSLYKKELGNRRILILDLYKGASW